MIDNNLIDQELDWDDEIEDDGYESILLPEGDYKFKVVKMERGRFPGSAKIGSCPKATLTLRVDTDDGIAFVQTDLLLNKAVEFKISSFFRCIGKKEKNHRVKMAWNEVEGSVGKAHFKPRKYTDKNGNEREVNNVERYYDYNPKDFPGGVSAQDDMPF